MGDPISPWTGFYVGGSVGGIWSHLNNSLSVVNSPITFYFRPSTIPAVNESGSFSLNASKVSAGAQVGYNRQFNNMVGGLEIGYNYGNMDVARGGSFSYATNNFRYNLTSSTTIKQLLTIRPRFGWVVGNAMPYITGGLALSKIKFNQEFIEVPFTPTPAIASLSKTRVGWTLGIGDEYSINNRWSLKAEYLFSQLGRNKAIGSLENANGSFSTGFIDGATFNNSLKLTTQALVVGVNFHFA
jgi:outer membrane immunogenic protein